MKEEITFTMGLRGGTFRQCYPRYSELSVEYSREDGEMAFGQKLSGSLKFIDTDYDWIMSQDRGVEILVRLNRSGIEFFGKFVITDCEIDEDNRKIEVELEADDAYSWLKAHLDDTFNLVGLAPRNEVIEYQRRACWQFYRQGDKKLTAVMGGDYFEMDATQTASHSDLVSKYYFNIVDGECSISTGYSGDVPDNYKELNGKIFKGTASGYLYADGLANWRIHVSLGGTYGIGDMILQNKVNSVWTEIKSTVYNISPLSITVKLQDSSGMIIYTYGDGTDTYFTGMYSRIVHNNAAFSPKYDLPTEDIVARTLNYNYVSIPSSDLVDLYGTKVYSDTPTEWGFAPDNVHYYKQPQLPASTGITGPFYPVGKTTWGEYSWWTWFNFSQSIFDYRFWNTVQLRDAYPLDAVLSVLLGAIFKDSGYTISFEASNAYSEFFYGANTGNVEAPPHLYITPKTNVLSSNYSQKAQKGDITIAQVLDMLRDIFRCYWFIERQSDGTYRLRIEQIFWFYNGGSYGGGSPYDIRNAKDPRTGKKWEFGQSKFKFDISELYKRYEFGWQDECTDFFDGDAVTCLAKYVNKSATNKVKIEAFTSDLDYMLLNPEEFSKDGFALLGAGEPESLMSSSYRPTVTISFTEETSMFALKRTSPSGAMARCRIDSSAYLPIYIAFYNSAREKIGRVTATDGKLFSIPGGTAYVTYQQVFGSPETTTASIYLYGAYNRVEIPDTAIYKVAPQNYRLAFHYIERKWYLWDYPCRNIAFGEGDEREPYLVWAMYPVKRSMEQEISLPWEEMFDPYKGVLSTKGRALVNTYTINLLSLFQKLTLRYGTNTK